MAGDLAVGPVIDVTVGPTSFIEVTWMTSIAVAATMAVGSGGGNLRRISSLFVLFPLFFQLNLKG